MVSGSQPTWEAVARQSCLSSVGLALNLCALGVSAEVGRSRVGLQQVKSALSCFQHRPDNGDGHLVFLPCAQMNSPLEIAVPGQNRFSVFSLDHLADVPWCPLAAGRKVMLLKKVKNRMDDLEKMKHFFLITAPSVPKF